MTELETVGDTNGSGTLIRFKADPEIFRETVEYDYDTLALRLREQAFLNAGLSISLTDRRSEDDTGEFRSDVFCYEGGIRSFVEFIHERRGLTRFTTM